MFSSTLRRKKLKTIYFTLKTHQMLSFYTSPEKFKNGVYTQKIQQISSVHTTPEKFKNATIQSPLDLCSRKNTGREIVFEMICFQNCFCPHGNAKSAFLNSSGLNSVYEKLCFREGFRCVFKFLQCNVSGRSLRLKLPWILVGLSLRCIEDLAWLLRAWKFYFLYQ